MPHQALRPCPHPGCPELVAHGYCKAHERKPFQTANAARPAWQHLYNTKRWQEIRRYQLMIEPWCREHMKQGQQVRATDCDHIVPHRGDPVVFFRGPFQSLCKACHSRKTLDEVLDRGVGV